MGEFVGEICPVCKQEIYELDKVTVCPDCGMPHHTDCWEMNGGCSTFGCAQQGSVNETKPMATCSKCGTVLKEGQEFCPKCGTPQNATKKNVCAKCGAELQEGQEFCPKCGTPQNAAKKNVCAKCGAELQEGQEFCPKCGQKVGLALDNNVASAISKFNSGVVKANAKKKKTPIIICVVLVILVLVALAIKVVAPKIFISMEGYMAQGNYEKAYEKAKSDDDKLKVKAENAVAVQSAYSADNLKDPSSFSLRDAYYDEVTTDEGNTIKQMVLYISGANSYGANVSSYWLYTWTEEEKNWDYFCSVSDLSEEEYSDYDDADEITEKFYNNIGRASIRECMEKGIKLDKDSIKRINKLFEDDTLDDVDLLDVE